MIEFDPNISSLLSATRVGTPQVATPAAGKTDFSQAVKAVGNYVAKVDDLQQASDASVQDLLTGKSNDITAVVSAAAKADMSFKLLVGVRNKLIEAYKQTMNMPL
jgi:flagellar hook-basal body complex protein FliE